MRLTFQAMTFATNIGKIFSISPENLLQNVNGNCIIQITVDSTQQYTQSSNRDIVYIGQNLFDNYYVVFDWETQKLGLSGFTTDITVPDDSLSGGMIALIVMGVLSVISFLYLCIS